MGRKQGREGKERREEGSREGKEEGRERRLGGQFGEPIVEDRPLGTGTTLKNNNKK